METSTTTNPTVEDLSPLSPEIIKNQATIIIGTLGHVSHGKSTLVEALTGIKPIKFDDELRRNITIKLGYAGFKVFKCPKCPDPECYQSTKSNAKEAKCKLCSTKMELLRHFAFVDCPGHDMLIATLLNGAAVMDAAILLVAANQPVPQPQTAEHLAAASIMNLENMIVVQSKLDLIDEQKARENCEQIREFVVKTPAESSPIIPICCTPQLKLNMDILLQYMCEKIPIPKRDFKSPACMTIVRSFDVNTPGTPLEKMKGGVAGGTLKRGILKIGDSIEIRPGLVIKNDKNGFKCQPLKTKIISMFADSNSLQMAVPGGLIGVGTTIDPTLTKGDRLVGHVLGAVGTLPDVFVQLEVKFRLMRKVVGLGDKNEKVSHLRDGEKLKINVSSMTVSATIIKSNHKEKLATFLLSKPVCAEIGECVSLSRQVEQSWRLIGNAQILSGKSALSV